MTNTNKIIQNPLKLCRYYHYWYIDQLYAALDKYGNSIGGGGRIAHPESCSCCTFYEDCQNLHEIDFFGENEESIRSSIIPPHVEMFTRFKQLYLQNFCISGGD